MVRINRVYTRAGDDGTTALGSGRRVAKDSARVEAYGTVDELNSVIGLAIASGLQAEMLPALATIQPQLYNLGADLCRTEDDKTKRAGPQAEARHVKQLEAWIDAWNEKLPPLTSFVLPGGGPAAAQLHVARTVCRRAERRVLRLSREEPIGGQVMPYLNRLSDLLFVAARYQAHLAGEPEVLWDSRAF